MVIFAELKIPGTESPNSGLATSTSAGILHNHRVACDDNQWSVERFTLAIINNDINNFPLETATRLHPGFKFHIPLARKLKLEMQLT